MSQNQEQTDSQRKRKIVRQNLGSYCSFDELKYEVESAKEQFPEASDFTFQTEENYENTYIDFSYSRFETNKEKEEREKKEEYWRKVREESERLKYEELKRKFENG